MRKVSIRTVKRCLLVFGIAVGCVVDQDSITRYQTQLNERKGAAIAKQTDQAQEENRSELIESDSEIAMHRVKSGCLTITLTANNKPVLFSEKLRVFDSNTYPKNPKTPRFDKQGNPINGVQFIPPGITVCNTFGDTAIVGDDGFVTDIKRVEQSKLKDFKEYLK